MMDALMIKVTRENPNTSICKQLIAELSAELGPLYGTDGTALFKPEDAMVPRSAFVVAWLDDEPVGCGALRPMDEGTTAEIKRMFVQKNVRGHGISRQILSKLEEAAAEFDYQSVILETGIYQTEAIGLYESSGYVRSDCYEPYVDSPHSLCYQKTLKQNQL